MAWRLKFIDIDSSFTISTEAEEITGYMVVRAPKGTTTPVYFPSGNKEAIYATIGLGTAHYPDIVEAAAFNNEYGILISAPAGSSEEYPSYFGGKYLTTRGLFDFYKVTDKENPNFLVPIGLKKESSFGSSTADVKVDIAPKGDNDDYDKIESVKISNLDKPFMDVLNKIVYKSPNGGVFEFAIVDPTEIYSSNGSDIALLNKDGSFKEVGETKDKVVVGNAKFGDDGCNITFNFLEYNEDTGKAIDTDMKNIYSDRISIKNHSATSYVPAALTTPDSADQSVKYFFKNGDNYESIVASAITQENISDIYVLEANNSTPLSEIEKFVVDGDEGALFEYNVNGEPKKLIKNFGGLTSCFTFILNINKICYTYITQRSCTEKVTSITLDGVGYDMFKYDERVKWASSLPINLVVDENTFAPNSIYDGEVVVQVTKPASKDEEPTFKVFRFENKALKDITNDYKTKILLLSGSDITANAVLGDEYSNTFIYVNGSATAIMSETGNGNLKLIKDINYNTVTVSCAEQVYPGSQMAGCQKLQGSLDEEGTDSFGSSNYWPNILPEDALSFIDVVPVNTLEAIGAIDNSGVYTGKRLGMAQFTIKGQRYVTHIVEDNIAKGLTGCAGSKDAFLTVVQQGWDEMNNPDLYDTVYVGMEPTGYEELKATLSSLREALPFTFFVAPRLLTVAEATNPSTIAVSGRSRGVAQYVGEFMVKCPYTSKKYFISPVGDIGVNLCRIIENKLGGWAPMYQNTSGLGGQLSRSVLKSKWNFTDAQTKILDDKGINPIIYNANDGLMMVSQKTSQDPMNTTDWSYIGHVLAFDLCKREIRLNVMKPMIGKPISNFWMNQAQQKVNAILEKRISGADPIWTAATCDVAKYNTDVTKAQRKFCIYVRVKVTVFAEIVELTFENVAQTTVMN